MQELRANTAVDVLIGPFVEDGDGDTVLDALTIDVELSKNGQALADSESAAPTHDSKGWYNCVLGTTDTNEEGTLMLVTHHADALPVWHEFMVLSQVAWDSRYEPKDTGYMDVNVKAISEDTVAADNLESACDNYSVTRGLTGTALPAAVAAAAGGVPLSSAGSLEMDTLADWVNAGRLDAILDVIAADTTTDIPALIAALENISTADVNAQCDTALSDYAGPTKAEMDTGHGLLATEAKQDTIDGVVGTILIDTADMQPRVVAIETDTGTTLDGKIDALNDISAADVNTQVLDVLNTDTFDEPGDEELTVNTTLVDKIGYLYKFLRNKIETTATRIHVYNAAEDNKDQSSIISDDDTTFTRGEFGAGD